MPAARRLDLDQNLSASLPNDLLQRTASALSLRQAHRLIAPGRCAAPSRVRERQVQTVGGGELAVLRARVQVEVLEVNLERGQVGQEAGQCERAVAVETERRRERRWPEIVATARDTQAVR